MSAAACGGTKRFLAAEAADESEHHATSTTTMARGMVSCDPVPALEDRAEWQYIGM